MAEGSIRLRVGDQYAFQVQIADEEWIPVGDQGETLRRITVRIGAPDDAAHEELLQMVQTAKEIGVVSVETDDRYEEDWKNAPAWRVGSHWKVADSSYVSGGSGGGGGAIRSFISAPAAYWHTLRLEEQRLEKLVLNGVEFRPYAYAEEYDGQSLKVKGRVKITADQLASLHDVMRAPAPISVVRVGISDEPRQMRFGQMMWSQDGADVKHELYLIDTSFDDGRPRYFMHEREANLERMAAETAEVVDALLSTLVAEGTLTDAQAERIKQRAAERLFTRRMYLSRVNNLDDWTDD